MKSQSFSDQLFKFTRSLALLALRPKSINLHGIEILMDYERWSPAMLRAFFKDNYELDERTMVPAILEPGDRVLEIGSAIGFLGMLSSDIVGAGNVTMVEANPELIEAARRNLELNSVSPTLLHGAVVPNANTKSISFHVHEDFWSSSLDQKEGTRQMIEVEALPLPVLLDRYEPNVLIMDIEGGEYDLLTQVELKGVTKLCVEVHARYIGDEKVSELIRHLILDGFDLVQSISMADNLYFRREKSRNTVPQSVV